MTPQGNYDSCYKVMESQYLLANNDSPVIIMVKFEHSTLIRIRTGNT